MEQRASGQNLVRPTMMVDFYVGNHVSLVHATDNLLLKLGMEGAKAVVELVSRVVEGAFTGGAAGATAGIATRNFGSFLLLTILGALAGGVAGAFVEEATTRLVMNKEYGNWCTLSHRGRLMIQGPRFY